MTTFSIAPQVADLLPCMQVVVVVVQNIKIGSTTKARVQEFVQKATTETTAELAKYTNAQSHPMIARYRDTLKAAAGISAKKFPQSNESLYKRLIKTGGPLPPINLLVDFYNAVSIKYGVPAGAYDIDDMLRLPTTPNKDDLMELRFTRDGDTFLALDAGAEGEAIPLPAGELGYARGPVVLTRHLAWRQSVQGLVSDESKNIIFITEIFNESASSQVSELVLKVQKEFVDGMQQYFDADISTQVVLGKGLECLSTSV